MRTAAGPVTASFNVVDSATYGVAMPIAVRFSAPVLDRAAAERALSVRTSTPTEGGWAWLDDREVHWRPREYWQPGMTVTVTARLYRVPLGGGALGALDLTSTFTIGRAASVRADASTHRFEVIRDGRQVYDFPASFGVDGEPGQMTRSGVLVVTEKQATAVLSDPKYGYRNVSVPWAVRMSDDGGLVYGNAAITAELGRRNVTHGAIALSPDDAKQYFDEAQVGDPVEVTGSGVALSAKDDARCDWAFDWPSWQARSALR
ncbi:L,D-transpeptidase [Solihabitans fulvus]|uniref:L,D-transpeptidase n=1 Tax=Solihabitans fulvus TaxID=1892852 RepID=A0A5B2XDT9_9PSEU|nr:L,D-transpeptidase [Solihabitans fulvus]